MKLKKQERVSKQLIEVTSTVVEQRSFSLLRLVGYILLAFSLIDYLAILIPPRLTDSAWEFKTISQLVDHIWSPILGLALIFFYTKNNWVSLKEISVLRCLSWAALILGLFYLLLLPLGINNSLIIYYSTSARITNQLEQQTSQLQKLNQQLNIATTPDELNTIAKIINPQTNTQFNVPTGELKNRLSQQIHTALQSVSTTAKTTKQQQSINLIKEAVRVNLGTVLAGACLITVWHLTRWVRISSTIDVN